MSDTPKITITVQGSTGVGKSGVSQLILYALTMHNLQAKYTDTVDGSPVHYKSMREIGQIMGSIRDHGVEIEIIEKMSWRQDKEQA
jgi:hypothetical protein